MGKMFACTLLSSMNFKRMTSSRCVDIRLFNKWEEIVSVASTLELFEENDEMIWQHNASGVYSINSLYSIINFRGVTLVYIPVVWNLINPRPPRVHMFLWLLSKNNILTHVMCVC
jgi:hypothetical protein